MSKMKKVGVDIAIFAGFLVALEPRLTGIAIHEWLSLALAATLIIHIVLHWNWVITVGVQFFRKLFHSSRLNFLVDGLLFVVFVLVMLSGILISESVVRVFGLQLRASPGWRLLHARSADASLILTGLHFALHWKWVVETIQHSLIGPLGRTLHPKKLQPSQVTVPVKDE